MYTCKISKQTNKYIYKKIINKQINKYNYTHTYVYIYYMLNARYIDPQNAE
jgi:hypothetical protein